MPTTCPMKSLSPVLKELIESEENIIDDERGLPKYAYEYYNRYLSIIKEFIEVRVDYDMNLIEVDKKSKELIEDVLEEAYSS